MVRGAFIIIAICTTLSTGLFAQYPMMRQYTAGDGMPSSLVYTAIQDQHGHMWFATDKGVSKFDGYSFKNFSLKDGLTQMDIWGLMEDEEGRIWLSTFNDFLFIQNDSVQKITLEELQFRENRKVNHFKGIGGHYVFIPERREVFRLQQKGNSFSVAKVPGPKKNPYQFVAPAGESSSIVYLSGENMIGLFQADIGMTDTLFRCREKVPQTNQFPYEKVFICGREVHEVNAKRIMALGRLPSTVEDVIKIKKINDSLIFLKCPNSIHFFDQKIQQIDRLKNLSQLDINIPYLDQHKNLWLPSNQGVFFLTENASRSKTYQLEQKRGEKIIENDFTALAFGPDSSLWIGARSGKLYRLDISQPKAQLEEKKLKYPRFSTNEVNDLLFDHKGNLWMNGGGGIKTTFIPSDKINEPVFDLAFPVRLSSEDISFSKKIPASNEQALFTLSSSKGFYLSTDKKDIIGFGKFGLTSLQLKNRGVHAKFYSIGRTYAASPQGNGIWVGQPNGLQYIDFSTGAIIPYNDRHQAFSTFISDIISLNERTICIATAGSGLLLYDKEKVHTFAETEGIYINDLFLAADSTIYAGTNGGVYAIEIQSLTPFAYTFTRYTRSDGLASNQVNKVVEKNGRIYAATTDGLTILKEKEADSIMEHPQLWIKQLSANGEVLPTKDRYILKHQQNAIRIDYHCFSYKSDQEIDYLYRLLPNDTAWQKTENRQLEFSYLPPGNYSFQIKATDIDGITSTVQQINFIIQKAWWQKWWFWVVSAFALAFLLFLYLQWQIQRVKKKSDAEKLIDKKFAELELRALQAQMNPHFIFNALHSIQDFIFSKDEKVANQYIVKFSRLMRLFLESSKEKYVKLEDEIKMLRLYIELEKLRFGDKFQYAFIIDPRIQGELIDIPSMLIQPYVENAINHGLAHKQDGPGLLSLKMTVENEIFQCIIEDNGIGRKKAKELREKSFKSYKSRGMKLVEDRKKVLNMVEDSEIHIEVIDLQDENGIGKGTRIEISFPI